ncbi:MAG: hypothetical protein ACOC3V_01185 [bacterium]
MHRIEYKLDLNENKRPCVDLPEEYEDKPEHKFFAIELTRYILQNVYDNRIESMDIDSMENLEQTISVLGQISDEMAMILWDNMKNNGDLSLLIDDTHHIKVSTKKDLDDIPKEHICYNDKIYEKRDDVKVLVEEDMNIYVYVNDNWEKK